MPSHRDESAYQSPPQKKPQDNKDLIQKIKKITLILTVVSGLIVAGVKLVENITLAMTIAPHVKQLQADLDKSYDRTHAELEKYNNRP